MRRRMAWIATLTVVLLAPASIVIAQPPILLPILEIPFTFNGDFAPKKLSKTKPTPIKLNVSGNAQPTDRPSSLREVVLEADRHGSIDVEGLAICTAAKLEGKDTEQAKKACPKAIIGRGMVEVVVEYAENAPFVAKSTLVAFNRGVVGRQTTILIHAYFEGPMWISAVARAKVSKITDGRFGHETIVKVPKLADGYGFVRSFSLTLDHGHENTPYLYARCPSDGRLLEKITGVFADGTQITGTFLRPCTPKPGRR